MVPAQEKGQEFVGHGAISFYIWFSEAPAFEIFDEEFFDEVVELVLVIVSFLEEVKKIEYFVDKGYLEISCEDFLLLFQLNQISDE